MEIAVLSSSQATSFSATSFRKDSDVVMTSCHVISCHMPKAWHRSMESPGPLKCKPITVVLLTDSHVLCCCLWKAISWHARYSKLGYLNLVSTLDTCILHTQTGAWLATCFLFKINTLTTCLGRGTVQSLAMPCSEGI